MIINNKNNIPAILAILNGITLTEKNVVEINVMISKIKNVKEIAAINPSKQCHGSPK